MKTWSDLSNTERENAVGATEAAADTRRAEAAHMLSKGLSIKAIAQTFGVTPQTVRYWVSPERRAQHRENSRQSSAKRRAGHTAKWLAIAEGRAPWPGRTP